MSTKYKSETVKGAPRKDSLGRDLVVEQLVAERDPEAEKKAREGAEPEADIEPELAPLVRVSVPGIAVTAYDGDGAGLARALATLAGMQPEVKG